MYVYFCIRYIYKKYDENAVWQLSRGGADMVNLKFMEYAQQVRKNFKKYDDMRDAGLTQPSGIRRYDSIRYGQHPDNVLDIYIPDDFSTPLKTIVSVHGGAYVYGNKERYQYYCMNLAERGFVVVNFTYRLAPEHPYPAALEDVNTVFRWIEQNGADYGMDLQKLFVVGDSAGAQLAVQYLTMLTNSDYASLFSVETPGLSVQGCALNCGMYQIRRLSESKEHHDMFDAYLQGKENEFSDQLDTLRYVTKDFPPAFVMTAVYDIFREEPHPLLCILEEKEIPHLFRIYGKEGEGHMSHVFHLNLRLQEAEVCNSDECAFFDWLCGAKDGEGRKETRI